MIHMNETEAIKEAYAALNRNDVEGFVKDFDPQIERIEFEGSPMAGTFIGIEAVKKHVTQGRSTWAEGGCEPERFLVLDATDEVEAIAAAIRDRVRTLLS